MVLIEERKRVQDKLVLLNGKELDEVDAYIESLIERRHRIADILHNDIVLGRE